MVAESAILETDLMLLNSFIHFETLNLLWEI